MIGSATISMSISAGAELDQLVDAAELGKSLLQRRDAAVVAVVEDAADADVVRRSLRSARISSTASGPPPTSTARRSNMPAAVQLRTARVSRMRMIVARRSGANQSPARRARHLAHLEEEQHQGEAAEDRRHSPTARPISARLCR